MSPNRPLLTVDLSLLLVCRVPHDANRVDPTRFDQHLVQLLVLQAKFGHTTLQTAHVGVAGVVGDECAAWHMAEHIGHGSPEENAENQVQAKNK